MKKMRYGPVVILALFVVLFTAMAFAGEIPAPFCAAKMHAMSKAADADGDYIWKYTRDKDGEQINYVLVYLPEAKAILIGRELFICSYSEDTGEILAGVFIGMGVMPINKPPEEIIEFAFEIFRELVEANALLTII